jgi:hypothetical protein
VPPNHLPELPVRGKPFRLRDPILVVAAVDHETVIAADDIRHYRPHDARPSTKGATMMTSLTFCARRHRADRVRGDGDGGLPVIGSSITDRRLSGV